MKNSVWTQQPLEQPLLNHSKPNFLNSNTMWNKTQRTFYSSETFLWDQRICILSCATHKKTPHSYNHGVTVHSFIYKDTSWPPSLICHVLDNCMGSGQKNHYITKNDHWNSLYYILIYLNKGRWEQQTGKVYNITRKAIPANPQASLSPPNCNTVLPRRLWKDSLWPSKGLFITGYLLKFTADQHPSFLLPHLWRRVHSGMKAS